MKTQGYELCVLIRYKLGCVELCRGVARFISLCFSHWQKLTQVINLMTSDLTESKKDFMTHDFT